MRMVLALTLCCAGGMAVADAAEAPSPRVAAEVLTGAGYTLNGAGWPGAPFPAWADMPESQVTHLTGDWHEMLMGMEAVGPISVVTANEALLHLATGKYAPYRGDLEGSLVLSKGVDLRLVPEAWDYAVAVLEGADTAPGVVFFDSAGAQVHRILLTEESDRDAFAALVAEYKGTKPEFKPVAPEKEETVPLTAEAKVGLLDGWSAIEDTHEFAGLLSEFKAKRTDAMRAAEGRYTERLDAASYAGIFQNLMQWETPFMVFVANHGAVQISTGALLEVQSSPGLLQFGEEDARFVLNTERVSEAWRVTKPTKDRMIHSLELYDGQGEVLAYFFGLRKAGEEAMDQWEKALLNLPIHTSSAPELEAAPATESAAAAVETTSVLEPVDVSLLSERTQGQLGRIVNRILAYDKNGDGKVAEAELPSRMRNVMAKANMNGDAFLEESELNALAYSQIQQRREERAAAVD